MNWPLDDERAFWQSACMPGRHPRYLWWFLLIACGWDTLRAAKPKEPIWINDPIQQDFCAWVQQQLDDWRTDREAGVDRRRHAMVLVSRGGGKSHTVTIAGHLTLHLADPDMTSAVGSEVIDNASDFLTAARQIMAGESKVAWFAWLFGSWKPTDPTRSWNTTDVVHAYRADTGKAEPSMKAFGVDTGVTSKHPLAAFLDDLLSYERLTAQAKAGALTLYQSLMYAMRSTGLVFLIGTRYEEDDHFGTLMRTEGVATWSGLPCPDKDALPRAGGLWHVFYAPAADAEGTPTFPSVWPTHRMESERRADPGKFSAQGMLDPTTSEYQVLTRDMIAGLLKPRAVLDTLSIRYITLHGDTAFKTLTQLQSGDYNVLVQGCHENDTGRVVIDDIRTDMAPNAPRWTESTFLTQLGEMLVGIQARMLHCRALTLDKPIGGNEGTLENTIRSYLAGVNVRCPQILWINRPRSLERGKNKPARIRASLTYWREGYLWILDDCPNKGFLIEQVLKVDQSPHDDVADAAADLFLPDVWVRPQRLPGDTLGRPPRSPMDAILKAARPWDTTEDMLADFDTRDTFGRPGGRRWRR